VRWECKIRKRFLRRLPFHSLIKFSILKIAVNQNQLIASLINDNYLQAHACESRGIFTISILSNWQFRVREYCPIRQKRIGLATPSIYRLLADGFYAIRSMRDDSGRYCSPSRNYHAICPAQLLIRHQSNGVAWMKRWLKKREKKTGI